MPKRIRSKIEKEVDAELEAKTKDELLAEFAQSQSLHAPAKKSENKLISIRLPMAMIKGLRDIAIERGDIGYQQLIKVFIADGLSRSGANVTSHILEASTATTMDTREALLNRPLQTPSSVSGPHPGMAA